jgi:polyphosphate kinase
MSRKKNAAAAEELSLDDPSLYLQRELSLLEFQARVLSLARDRSVPLLERLRFLAISSSNLDEFFEIRVAGWRQRLAYGVDRIGAARMTPAEVLGAITKRTRRLVRDQYKTLNDELLPDLREEGVRLLRREQWTERQAKWLRSYFQREVLPVLTPIGLDPAHPFPRTQNKSLNLVVDLAGQDGFGREVSLAVVQVPRSLPRVLRLPKQYTRGYTGLVLLSSVIHAHVDSLFQGLEVRGCYQFRVTRDSDLWVDEEEVDDLLHAIQGELSSRGYSDAVRLEVADNCPKGLAEDLLEKFGLAEDALYRVNGPVNLHRLGQIVDLVDRPDLKWSAFVPGLPFALRTSAPGDLFAKVRRRPVLLHHPYQSFRPVIDLLEQAATDPDVLAVKQTLYRTGEDSPVVDALVRAAQAGKEVTAVIELRARFDEEANIGLARRLQEVGAKVVYGVVGFKTHAKLVLVVRREGRKLRRYVHLGTGNYHAGTTRAYEDFGLICADPDLGEDVHQVFHQLTGPRKQARLKKLLQSPFTVHSRLVEMIEAEARAAEEGRPAWIQAKVNSLNDPEIIRAFYRASRAGVQVDLIVRGICCLRPGVPGVSDRIRVRSVLGRFLEHSRAFAFCNGGEPRIYLGSADLMGRNLHGRVEVLFPVELPRHQTRVMQEAFEVHLREGAFAWDLREDGSYRRAKGSKAEDGGAQIRLLEALAGLTGV